MNNHDRIDKGRTNAAGGEAHHWARLTDEQVTEIRRLHQLGGISQTALARRFDVDPSTVSVIVRNKRRAS